MNLRCFLADSLGDGHHAVGVVALPAALHLHQRTHVRAENITSVLCSLTDKNRQVYLTKNLQTRTVINLVLPDMV